MNTLQERLRANPLPLPNVMELCREAADRIDADAERIKALEGAIHSCHPGCARAGCVNEKLRDAIEEQRRIIETLKCGMPDDGTTPVIRRIAALEADAERYRWLRSPAVGPSAIWELVSDDAHPPHMTLKCGADLDAAIDAARSKK